MTRRSHHAPAATLIDAERAQLARQARALSALFTLAHSLQRVQHAPQATTARVAAPEIHP